MLSSPSTSTCSDLEPVNCRICFQTAHGNHFGAISCRACAAFFRRSVVGSTPPFKCRIGDEKCRAKGNGRFLCKKCRLDRCFEAGMTSKKLQHDRDPISSTHNFVVSRKRKLLSSIIPHTVQGFLGRPLFILSCEPDLAASGRVFIDVKFLIDHASDLFDDPVSKKPEFLNSVTLLDKLTYGLKTTRHPTNYDIICHKVGKAETLLCWEYEFMTVAKWLTYCDEFQQLPKNLKIQFLKSIWFMWIRLERITIAATMINKESKKFMMTSGICVDLNDLDFDINWFTKYKKEQLTYFLDPQEVMFIPKIIEPLNQLEPSIQEMTYMLCLLSFRHGGKQFGGDIQSLTDRLIENVANDLHSYYLNDMKLVNYAGRMAKMMKIVQFVERDVHERIERTELARMFDIFLLDFSHPEMFSGFRK